MELSESHDRVVQLVLLALPLESQFGFVAIVASDLTIVLVFAVVVVVFETKLDPPMKSS